MSVEVYTDGSHPIKQDKPADSDLWARDAKVKVTVPATKPKESEA